MAVVHGEAENSVAAHSTRLGASAVPPSTDSLEDS